MKNITIRNTSKNHLVIQVELTGIEHNLLAGEQLSIEPDLDPGQDLEIEIADKRIIIWGGVAATLNKP